MQQKKRNINGFLNIYKELGDSSNKTLSKIKRILKPSKIGHGGTLDVMAEGVLPVAFGEATKTLQFLLDSNKEYEFCIEWGYETDTFDSEGEITSKNNLFPEKEELLSKLDSFVGEIDQIPPVYSALKFDGKSAYKLAREGKDVDISIKKRKVNIYSLELLKHEDNKSYFRAVVSKGTYIRSLGVDIARSMGGCATIIKLVRTKTKKFNIEDSITVKTLDELLKSGHNIEDLLLDVDIALDNIPVFIISKEDESRLNNGQIRFKLEDIGLFRIYSQSGVFLSIVENDGSQIKILRNFNL